MNVQIRKCVVVFYKFSVIVKICCEKIKTKTKLEEGGASKQLTSRVMFSLLFSLFAPLKSKFTKKPVAFQTEFVIG